eukprot:XP_006503366.1 PREDICTED: metalloendopeptidase OMA1, mitochondrial isoform X5 [Mus musculus]
MISAASSQGIIVLQQPLESLSFWQNWCRNYSRHGFAWIQHSHAKYQGGVEFLAGSLNLGYPPPTTRGRDGATVRTAAAGQDWDWGNGLGSHKGGAKSAGEVPRAGSEGAGLGKGVRLRGAGCWIPLGLWLQCALTWMEEFKNDLLPERDPRYLTVKEMVYHLTQCNRDVPGISETNWVVHVVDSPAVNAFVLPNGQVFIFTGLLNSVTDVHQLSFLLGHEIAHAVLGHAAEKASLVHLLDFLGMIFLTMIWAICPRDSLAVLGQWIQSKLQEYMFDRPYSRTLEAEADKVGLQLAAKACADVRASSVFWQQMEFSESLHGYPKLPEWLSTHPSHGNRAEYLDRLIPQALKLREVCNCPPLSGPDPRLLFRLTVKRFLEDSEKEDLNITVKKQKTDALPMQKQEQIPLTYVLEKRTAG